MPDVTHEKLQTVYLKHIDIYNLVVFVQELVSSVSV